MRITLAILLILCAGAAAGQKVYRTATIVHDFEAERVRVNLTPEVEYIPGTGIRLQRRSSGSYFRSGSVRSCMAKAPLPFNEAVFSYNFDLPEGTGAVVEVRALGDGGDCSAWYEMARLGTVPLPPERVKKDAFGSVGGCGMEMNGFWQWAQYRVTLYSGIPHRTPTLRLMAICYTDLKNRDPYVASPIPKEPQPWMRSLPARWRSQMWEERSINWRICGPTSMSVAMDYLGCNLPTAQVAADAWDDYGRMFGNWAFMAQAAAKRGFKSWVRRCRDFKALEEEIAAGRPAVIGIRFDNGELSNAPFKGTGGHLICCVGFTPQGDLICNDSASRQKRFDHIVYKRSEMAKVWLGQSGTLVCVVPRAQTR